MKIDNAIYKDKNAQFVDIVKKITLDTVFDYELSEEVLNQLKEGGISRVDLWYQLFETLGIFTIGQLRDAIKSRIITFNLDNEANACTLKLDYNNKELVIKSFGHDSVNGIESIIERAEINGFLIPYQKGINQADMISLDNFESHYKSSPKTYETLKGMSCLLFEKNSIVMPIIKEKIREELTQKSKELVKYPCGTNESLARQKELNDLIRKYKKLLNHKRSQRRSKLFIQDQKIGGYYEYTNKINRLMKRFYHNNITPTDAFNASEVKSRSKEQSIDDFSNLNL